MPTEGSFSGEFRQDEGLVYLNHAGVAPWPYRAACAVQAFAEENSRSGAWNYVEWMERERILRRQFQQLINAPEIEDIAFVKNTSEALSFVAAGLEWSAGDSIVTSDEEFPSNRIVWESLASSGVSLQQIKLPYDGDAEAELMAACDEHTKLLAVSSIQYRSGFRLDLERLGRFCKRQGILFCVDAIQSIGAVGFDVQKIGCDFAMADGHKWMLGPEGLGVFFVAKHARDVLGVSEYGWHMIEDAGNFDVKSWRIASSARRYECGSPNILGVTVLSASLSLLLEIGMDVIETINVEHSLFMIDYLRNHPEVLIDSPIEKHRLGGIVSFRLPGIEPTRIYNSLRAQNVVCAIRGGAIRYSPHFYIEKAHLEKALSVAIMTPEPH